MGGLPAREHRNNNEASEMSAPGLTGAASPSSKGMTLRLRMKLARATPSTSAGGGNSERADSSTNTTDTHAESALPATAHATSRLCISSAPASQAPDAARGTPPACSGAAAAQLSHRASGVDLRDAGTEGNIQQDIKTAAALAATPEDGHGPGGDARSAATAAWGTSTPSIGATGR